MRTKNILRVLIIGLTLLALIVGPQVQAQTAPFINLVTRKLTVLQSTTLGGDVAVTGGVTAATVTSTGAATLASLSVTGADTVGTFRYDTKAGNVTVTSGGTITPTGSYQPLTSAGNVGTSSLAGCASGTTGKVVELINVGSNTITLTDTGTLKLAGNAALGATDVLSVRCDGTNWIQRYKSDN